jgi:hypothetical protein
MLKARHDGRLHSSAHLNRPQRQIFSDLSGFRFWLRVEGM